MTVDDGTIVTFYSYKGGTGRSMSLANVAWILASNGRRVLVVDWDLEAPGLHRYFHPFLPDDKLRSSPGVIDMMWEFAHAAMDPRASDAQDWHVPYARTSPYAVSIDHEFGGGGTIDLMPAGRQDSTYSALVSTFDWDNFYDRLGGGGFLEALSADMRERYDYVLVDSRTGLSDTAGVCTVALPDVVVTCFSMSTQSIDGAAAVAASISHQRFDQLRILPVPMRVENGEHDKLETSRDYARHAFNSFLWHVDDVDRYWGQVEVPYRSYYAYEEILATIGDRPQQENTILAATERLVDHLTRGEISSLAATDSEQRRRELLGLFLRTKMSDASQHQKVRFGFKIFLTYDGESELPRIHARALLARLRKLEFDAELDPDLRHWSAATQPAKLVVVEAEKDAAHRLDTGIAWDPDTVIRVRSGDWTEDFTTHLTDQLSAPVAVQMPSLSVGAWTWGLDAVASIRALVSEELAVQAGDMNAYETSRLPVRWSAGGQVGTVQMLSGVFMKTPSRKLTILGEAGSGKSVAALLLAHGLLTQEENLVPVLLSPTAWRPTDEYFDDWVARSLAENYPPLRPSRNLEGDITRLVRMGAVVPVIDGLDELPLQEYEHALQQIADTTIPVIMTSRKHIYQYIWKSFGAGSISVIELLPIDFSDALRYLSHNTARRDDHTSNALEELPRKPESALAQVLASPSMISLARSYLNSPNADLTRLTRTSSEDEAREMLLNSYMSEAFDRRFRLPGEPEYGSYRPRRWLGFIATRPGGAFRWWDLHKSVSSITNRITLTLLTLCLTGAPVALTLANVERLNTAAIILWFTAGIATISPLTPTPSRPAPSVLKYLSPAARRLSKNCDERTIRTPESERNGALLTVAGGGLVGAILLLVWTVLYTSRDDPSYLAGAIVAGMWYGANIGVSIAMTTAWSRYMSSRLLLVCIGRLPSRLSRFLEDTRRRGILRQVGSVYEFRDRRLAEVLAMHYRRR